MGSSACIRDYAWVLKGGGVQGLYGLCRVACTNADWMQCRLKWVAFRLEGLHVP